MVNEQAQAANDDAPAAESQQVPAPAVTLTATSAPAAQPDNAQVAESTDETLTVEAARKLRSESANLRRRLNELEAQHNDARAKLTAFEDAKLSESERIAKQIETLQTQLADKERREAELTQTLQAERLRNRIVAEAAKLQIVDPDAAYKLLDLSEVERDEDGNATNLGKVLKDLVKAKPYLVAQQPAPAASPTNPAREDRQAAADPVSLLNTRSAVSIWDMGKSEALGGGVHWVEKPGN